MEEKAKRHEIFIDARAAGGLRERSIFGRVKFTIGKHLNATSTKTSARTRGLLISRQTLLTKDEPGYVHKRRKQAKSGGLSRWVIDIGKGRHFRCVRKFSN